MSIRVRIDEGDQPQPLLLWDSVWNPTQGCADWALADPDETQNRGGLRSKEALATAITLIGIFALLPRLSAAMRAEASRVGIVVGSMAGALSHPVLDGLMHQDIEPLQPWSASNPFRELISLQTLHLGCLAAGAVGLVLLVVWKRPDQGAAP